MEFKFLIHNRHGQTKEFTRSWSDKVWAEYNARKFCRKFDDLYYRNPGWTVYAIFCSTGQIY